MFRNQSKKHTGRNRIVRNSQSIVRRKRKDFGHFEKLEDRRLLAFGSGFDGTTLTLTQTVDDGAITIDNNGAADAFRATDGSGTTTYVAATNLVVTLLNATGNQLDLDLDNAHTGDIELNAGDGMRTVNFTGTGNAIGGNLVVNAGTDAQTVEVAVNDALTIGGNALFDLGIGADIVDEDGNDVFITGNLDFVGVNEIENNGIMFVGGNVSVDSSGETETTRFDDDKAMAIGGDFTFTGGDGRDEVLLNDVGVTTVGGNVFIDLADNTVGGTQFAWFNSADTTITGSVSVFSTNSGSSDDYQDIAGATINGDILIDFGDGANEADFLGTFGGSTVNYTGGSGVDEVVFDMSGSLADVIVNLGAGDDSFDLGPNSSISPTTLTVDFGDNNDTYTNNFGDFTFDAMLLGLLGFDYAYDSTTDSLSADEVSNAGAVEFDNNGINQAWRFNNGVVNLTPSTNFSVTMLDGTNAALDIDLDFALAGDLTVNLGDGTRALNFIGFDNSIGGNLMVTGGTDAQTVEVAVNNAFTVGGNALFDLGIAADIVDEDGNDVSITGNLDFVGVNEFENNGNMSVGGNVSVDSSGETETTRFDDDNALAIGGDFTFTGGDGRDEVLLNDAGITTVGGNVLIDLADNTAGGTQFAWFNSADTTITGNVSVFSTNSASSDDYQDIAGATINGDIFVQLGGGPNEADFLGTFGGANVKYNGGSGIDDVVFGMTGTLANVNIKLKTDDDSFTLEPGASISPTTLRVDFGGGNDTFINNFGAFTFDAKLLNWHGYNRFYTFATDSLFIQQVLDTGDVTIDNNGAGNAIRLLNGFVTEMTPATNVHLNLINGTSTNVTADLDSALGGNLILQLRSGARDVMFTGTSNTVGGLLRIEAADEVQNVILAVNADLNVAGNLVVNGRDGSDSIDDGANNINVDGHMLLRGINLFENTNALTVGLDFNMVSILETEDTRLDNDGTMNIGGNVNYIGGDGVDDVLLNVGGVAIGGGLFVNLGDGNDFASAQNISLTGGFSAGQVLIVGGNSLNGNQLVTDAGTNVAGDVIVNFAGSTTAANTALFYGTYGGTYGTYRGGSEADFVTFGAVGNDMSFAALVNDGNDVFTLAATTTLLSLFVDFGNGTDTFIDDIGLPHPFPVGILNLP